MDGFNLFSLLTGVVGIFNLFLFIFINAIFTCWVAEQKGYSAGIWFLLGLFGPIALLAIGFAPNLKTEETLNSIKESLDSKKSSKLEVPKDYSFLLEQTEYDKLSSYEQAQYYNKIAEIIEQETNKTIRKVYAQNLFDLGYIGCKKYLK